MYVCLYAYVYVYVICVQVGIHDMRSRKVGRRNSSVIVPDSAPSRRLSNPGTPYQDTPTAASTPQNLFQSYCGGIKAADGVYEIYYVGIIDILQLYNTRKRLETVFRSITEDG